MGVITGMTGPTDIVGDGSVFSCTWGASVTRNTWVKNTAYAEGDYIENVGNVYICITAGTTENLDDVGPQTTAADITDGTAHWAYVSAYDGFCKTNLDCTPVSNIQWADRSFQVTGTFNGATIKCEVSNDGTNYVPAFNAQGSELALTAANLKQVLEISRYIKPLITTAGTNPNGLVVTMIFRRPQPMFQ